MPIIESDRILFKRVWEVGAKVVRENRISALIDVTLNTPTLQQYQDSHGQRMTDMIKVVQLGISKIRGGKALAESEPTQTPTSSSRGPLKRAS
jgi:hypothetical protein